VQTAARDDIVHFAETLGWVVTGVIPSPITGGDGNVEFLLGARRD
jgi:23S rRNA (cytidine1920-2'-O)/16S rRNA (cytidine1409-2'-O)-methyltransferase